MKKFFSAIVIITLFLLPACQWKNDKEEINAKNKEFLEFYSDIPLPEGLEITLARWAGHVNQFEFEYIYPANKLIDAFKNGLAENGWRFIIESRERWFFTKGEQQLILMMSSRGAPVKGLFTVEPLGLEEIPTEEE